MAIIELENVTKIYGGGSRGVDDASMSIQAGNIVGFLGPNGAGKTTTISMLVDLIRPTSGDIRIFDMDAKKDGVNIRLRVGFLAGDFSLDESLTGWQQLEYFARLRGSFNRAKVEDLAKRLSANLSRPIKNLSRGNRQKIGLISALMHEPELLIFDEPTSGLDPLIQAEFNTIIREHKAAGGTAFISSHTLSEVQEICDEVVFIREGRIIARQAMSELAAGLPKQVNITSPDAKIKKALQGLKQFKMIHVDEHVYSGTYHGELKPLLTLLAAHAISDVTITEADLETVFMKYYGGQA